MKELKRYVRFKKTFEVDGVQIIDTKRKHIVKKSLGEGFVEYYDEENDITWQTSYILKTADTILELAEVGDYLEFNGKLYPFVKKGINGHSTWYFIEKDNNVYQYPTSAFSALWIKQNKETFKRYEVDLWKSLNVRKHLKAHWFIR